MDLKESDILGDDISEHWYYCSKAKAVVKFLGKKQPTAVLDIGAGSGFFSRYLLDNTSAQNAWCVDISYNEDTDAFQGQKPVYFRRSVDDVEVDVVLLMDVLEHVDDDVGLLCDYVNKVPKGAQFLISVPAFQFMWSGHDIFLEHKRRYRLHEIEDVARKAGLTIIRGAYYFGAVFPIAASMRFSERTLSNGNVNIRSQLTKHSVFVNGTLAALCSLELPFMRFNRAAGLTAFCLAEKV